MHKYVRRTLYPVLGLAIVFLTGLALTTTGWFHRYLQRRVAAELGRVTGARVEIARLQFSPFTLQIIMGGVILHGNERPPSAPLFSARALSVRLRPSSIFRRELNLASLDLNGAAVHVMTRQQGGSNIPGPLPTSAAGPTGSLQDFLNLAIGRMTINHTDVYWNDVRMAVNFSARNVAIQMRRNQTKAYQGSLSSSEVRFDMPGFDSPPTTVTSRFEVTKTGLKFTEINWRAPGLNGASTLEVKGAPSVEAEAAFHAQASAVQVFKMLRVGAADGGEIFVTGRATFGQGAWKMQGLLEGRQLLIRSRSFNPGRVDFKSDYTLASGALRLPNLQIAALGGKVRAKGEAHTRPDGPHFSVHAQIEGARLRNLLSALSAEHPLLNYLHWSSAIRGSMDASWVGEWKNLDSRIALDFQTWVTVPDASVPVNGSLSARLTHNQSLELQLDSLSAQTPHSTFRMQGMVLPMQTQLAFELKTTDFEEWRSPAEYLAQTTEPIPLTLQNPVAISGSLVERGGKPAISGRLVAGRFEFRGWQWNELATEVAVARNSFQISGGTLRSESSVLAVDALATLKDWQLDPEGNVQLVAHAEGTPLEGLKAALGADYPLKGLVTGQIELKGTPSRLGGGGQLQVDRGTLAGRPFDRLTASLQVENSVWNVENIQLIHGSGKVTGNGSFTPSSRGFVLSLHGNQIALSDFTPKTTPVKKDQSSRPFEGVAAFDMEGHGTLDRVVLQARWSVQALSVMGMPAGNLKGQIIWNDQTLRAIGESSGDGGTLSFSGEAHTEGDWPAEFAGQYSGFHVGPWIRLLLNRRFDSQVSSSGTFKLSGPLLKPEQMVIESRVQTLEVNASDLAWKNAQPIDLRFADGTVKVSRFSIQGPSTNLEMEGLVRFGQKAALSLSARGQSDAKLLSLLDPAVRATGTSKVDLVINGTPARPLLFGKLEVQDLNLSYGDFPIRLFGMNGEIRLEGERATVQSLRGTSGGGTVTVQGYMAFGGTPAFQLSAKVDQVRLQYPTDFVSQLAGTLRLSGTAENSRMDGELTIRQLYTTPDFNVLGLASDVGTSGGTPPIGAASPVASRVRLNVQLSTAPTVHVEAQDLRMTADVDLRLQGTLANPVVVGAIHILNGEAVLRGNRYTINRADISMSNPFRTQPMVDLEATTRIQRYDLTLDVSGPLSRIKIGYRSDPPLPTADILSLLALGYSRQQEQLATTGQEHLSSVGASAILSEALSSQMTGRIQRLFGVSRIKIDPNVGGPENVAGARVTVEQQVTRELTLTYITDTGSSQRRVVQFEWQVADNISLFGVRDRNGIFGVELRFRRRFH
jgi:translocation and assembly module TamB